MGHRMFAAVLPPESVKEEIERFLEPRPGLTWTSAGQWHLTLAFAESVDEWRIDELTDGLAAAARKHEPFRLRIAGAGAFPSVERAKVLWLGVAGAADGASSDAVDELGAVAGAARRAFNAAGAAPDGARFRPHLTLARLGGRDDATHWLRVLDTFTSSEWEVDEIALVDSFLGEGPRGRARHEVVARLPLGREDHRWWDRAADRPTDRPADSHRPAH